MEQISNFIGSFGMAIAIMIILICTVVFGIKGNWWSKYIVKDFDETGHPDECFMCNEGPTSCYRDVSCRVIERQIYEAKCG